MFIVIWEYQVKIEKQSAFEKIYSASGVWAELFQKGSGYLGTELIRSAEHSDQYITIDRWTSLEAYETFLLRWKEEYQKLDLMCEGLTGQERCLGRFGPVLS